jgi:hypothetical protein
MSKISRQGVFSTLKKSGWTQYSTHSTSVRGHWHDVAGWKVKNVKAGETIIVWHIQGTFDKTDVGERLSSYAHELRKAGYPAEIVTDKPIHYIRIKREENTK